MSLILCLVLFTLLRSASLSFLVKFGTILTMCQVQNSSLFTKTTCVLLINTVYLRGILYLRIGILTFSQDTSRNAILFYSLFC